MWSRLTLYSSLCITLSGCLDPSPPTFFEMTDGGEGGSGGMSVMGDGRPPGPSPVDAGTLDAQADLTRDAAVSLDADPSARDAFRPSDADLQDPRPADAAFDDAALADADTADPFPVDAARPPDAEPDPPSPEDLLTWIPVGEGSFTMGNYASDRPTGRPLRVIEMEAFEISLSEVTVEQYTACVDANACDPPDSNDAEGRLNWGLALRTDHPINGVTWAQATDFADWVGGRLPTEVEWEYVAKGQGVPFDPLYPWGIAEPTCDLAHINGSAFGGDVIVDEWGCGTGITTSVCRLREGKTLQGVCDMAGNVAEWVADYWHDTYDDAPNNQSARAQPSPNHPDDRVIRGGSLISQGALLQTHRRTFSNQHLPSWTIGFRVVRDLE